MNRSRIRLAAALWLVLCGVARAQEVSPFAPPAPAAELLPPGQAAPPAPPSPAQAIVAPPLGPNTEPISPREANAGLLFGLELELMQPHLGGSLAGGSLDTTVMPTFLIGYRFPSGRSLQLEYRYFGANADATAFLAGDPAPITIHRHIEGSIFDLDVRFRQSEWPLFFRSQWQLGARDANISVFASRPSTNYFSVVSSRFHGAGPHVDWRLSWAVFDTGLELFGRSDLAVLFGSTRGFSQQNAAVGLSGQPIPHTTDGKAIWNGRFQVGASYWFNWGASQIFVVGGYEVDSYYISGVGEMTATASGLSLLSFHYEPGGARIVNKGPFLRVEFKY